MKIYKLTELSDRETSGEYTLNLSLDSEDDSREGLSVTYLRFRETDEKKQLSPSPGFKGIAHIIKGNINVTINDKGSNFTDEFPVTVGEAFKLDGDMDISGKNISTGESIVLVTSGPLSGQTLESL